jgi:hypothetical protein
MLDDALTILGMAAICGVWVIVQRWSARESARGRPENAAAEATRRVLAAHSCHLCPDDQCHHKDGAAAPVHLRSSS